MSEIKTQEVEVIPNDAVIDLKIHASFLQRLNTFILEFFPFKDKEHFDEIIKHVKDNTNQDDPHVFHLTTLLSLQNFIEEEAKIQNKTKKIIVDLATGKPIEEENPQSPPVQSPPESQS